MPNKEPEFKISDRRMFTADGELRNEAEEREPEEEREPAKPATASKPAEPSPAAASEKKPAKRTAPSQEEQTRQHGEYKQSAQNMENELRKGYGNDAVPQFEATFDRVIEPFYVTALMQLGMMPTEQGSQPQVDIIGARHTIDTLTLLQQKTKGNLSSDEASVLENVIYQLRMRYIEVTNMIAQSVKEGQPGGPGVTLK